MLRKQLVGVEIKEEEEEMEVEALEETFAEELEVVEANEQIEASCILEQKAIKDEEEEHTLAVESEYANMTEQKNQLDSEGAKLALEQREVQPKKRRKGGRRKKEPEHPNRPRMNDHKCYICKSDSLGSAEALFVHLNSHSQDVPYTCTICVFETVTINNVSTLNVHKRMHENPYKCPNCDRRYSNKRAVQLHVQMYHDETACPSTCEYCGKICLSQQSLRNHQKIHTVAVTCEFCGKTFVEKHKLRLHIQRRHEKLKKYECQICHKKLSSLDAVQVHVQIVHSNQEFECQFCSKKYTSEVTLKHHEKKHENNPNYKSANDWKQYYTFIEGEEGLKDGVRLKKCGICGSITKAIGPHLKAMHFPTEHRCEQCGLTFKRKGTYDIHVLEHEHGKAHRCPICEREFSQRKNLLEHLRTKKHRDHPLAKSLDWLYGKSDASNIKVEHRIEGCGEVLEVRQVNEIEVGNDNFM